MIVRKRVKTGNGASNKAIFDEISTNGIKFGRWLLRVEGEDFVIRDTIGKSGDARYNFAPNRKVDV